MHIYPNMYIKTNSSLCINNNSLHTDINQYTKFNPYTKCDMYMNLNNNSLYKNIHQFTKFNLYTKFNTYIKIYIDYYIYINSNINMRIHIT